MPVTQWVIADNRAVSALTGRSEQNLKALELAYGARLTARGNVVAIQASDDAEHEIRQTLDLLAEWVYAGETVQLGTVEAAVAAVRAGTQDLFLQLLSNTILTTTQGRVVRPRTLGQQAYVEAIRKFALVFGIGPAGTGKTYLAMAMAVQALKAHDVDRIVLTRPAVEAGEKLGFLPGDLQDKVDPYIRPLNDALLDLYGPEASERARERGHIEIAPLAYMRGRTLSNSFVILDEAQNTTNEQMKMFLTRIGEGSRVVVTGDVTQMDLPRGVSSGLTQAISVLEEIPGIAIRYLKREDVVRHPLVAAIIDAYERHRQGQPGLAGEI